MRRRDFTVNAMARRLDDGRARRPARRAAPTSRRARLRTVSPQSFREDPLRLVRALRFVSQLGFEPDDELLEQMRDEAAAVKLVSGERIGGGLCSGRDGGALEAPARRRAGPRAAARARHRRPRRAPARVRSRDRLRPGEPLPRPHGRRAHLRRRPGRRRRGLRPAVRLAALFHDLGKPIVAWRGHDGRLHYYAKPGFAAHGHDQVGADLAAGALLPAPLPERAAEARRRGSCATTCSSRERATRAGRGASSPQYGDELAFDLIDHKQADLLGKRGSDGEPPPVDEIERSPASATVVEQERSSPHRLRDLASTETT